MQVLFIIYQSEASLSSNSIEEVYVSHKTGFSCQVKHICTQLRAPRVSWKKNIPIDLSKTFENNTNETHWHFVNIVMILNYANILT